MSHPPIPPNCPNFKRHGELFILQPARCDHTHVCVGTEDPPSAWIPVIAAVARCFWMDEAERLNTRCIAYQAHENAKAWAKWGKGEAWE